MNLKKHFGKAAGFLAVLALVLVFAQSADSSLAYFTTYTSATGTKAITLQLPEPDPYENYDHGTKDIVVENYADVDCYVRVRVIAGDGFGLSFSGDGWFQSGEYWEYSAIVPANSDAGPGRSGNLLVTITKPEGLEDDYNVIVFSEATPVQYNEDGTAKPADWSLAMEVTNG